MEVPLQLPSECSFVPTGEENAEGWKKHRCTKCGYVTVFIPPWSERIRKHCSHRGLGDYVALGLAAFGITKARVSWLLGKDCGCAERQEDLNEVGKKLGL